MTIPQTTKCLAVVFLTVAALAVAFTAGKLRLTYEDARTSSGDKTYDNLRGLLKKVDKQ